MSVSVSKLGFIGWAGAVGVGRLAVGYRIGYLGRCVNQLIVTQLVVLDYICVVILVVLALLVILVLL